MCPLKSTKIKKEDTKALGQCKIAPLVSARMQLSVLTHYWGLWSGLVTALLAGDSISVMYLGVADKKD